MERRSDEHSGLWMGAVPGHKRGRERVVTFCVGVGPSGRRTAAITLFAFALVKIIQHIPAAALSLGVTPGQEECLRC